MRLRERKHHREIIENEILSEFRYMPAGARRNVEEHGTCFSLEIGSSCGGEDGAAQVGFAFNGLRAVESRVHEVA